MARRRARYRGAVERGLPQVATAVADALAGGSSVRAALASAASSMEGPPAAELARLRADLELGVSTAVGLAALQTRFGSVVASLRVALGVVPAGVDPPKADPRPESRVRLTHEETEVVEAMVASLPDPALAGSLRRLLTKDLLARRRPDSNRRREDSRPAEREDS